MPKDDQEKKRADLSDNVTKFDQDKRNKIKKERKEKVDDILRDVFEGSGEKSGRSN